MKDNLIKYFTIFRALQDISYDLIRFHDRQDVLHVSYRKHSMRFPIRVVSRTISVGLSIG